MRQTMRAAKKKVKSSVDLSSERAFAYVRIRRVQRVTCRATPFLNVALLWPNNRDDKTISFVDDDSTLRGPINARRTG